MAIARKPKSAEKKVKEQDINILINRGGSVAEEINNKQSEDKPILIRVPAEVLKRIDEVVTAKKIKIPRHTWLLEAVFEKLERESRIL